MSPGSVFGFLSLPLITAPLPASRSVSPSDVIVIEPPTNSSAALVPLPMSVRTSPPMNVWMSPVTKTTSLICLSRMCLSSSSRSRG